jgi:hypothetical protein
MLSLAIKRWVFWAAHGVDNPPILLRYLVDAALAEEDEPRAEMFVRDWGFSRGVQISKYVPGTHFYALDRKFGSLSEARAFVRQQGLESLPDVLAVITPFPFRCED